MFVETKLTIPQDLQNNTVCQTALNTGIGARSLPDIPYGISDLIAYIFELYIEGLVARFRLCEKGISKCLVEPSHPDFSYTHFLSSLPKIKTRLIWAMYSRQVAAGFCRVGIHIQSFEQGFVQGITQMDLSTFLFALALSTLDPSYALNVSALEGQISWLSVGKLGLYFITFAAIPILFYTEEFGHINVLSLFTSIMVLVPGISNISDVASNAALATVSYACFIDFPFRFSKERPKSSNWNSVEGGLRDGVDLGRIHTPLGEALEPESVDLRNETSQRTKGTGDIASLVESDMAGNAPGELALAVGEKAPEHSNTAPDPFLGAMVAFSASFSGLWVVYLGSNNIGGVAGEIIFCIYCACHLLLLGPGMNYFAPHFQETVIQRGGTMEEVIAHQKAQESYAMYSIWGLLISTVMICFHGRNEPGDKVSPRYF